MQIHQAEASADVGLRSPHRLSGFISAIVHAINADKPWNRGALNRLHASRKIWQRDAEQRRGTVKSAKLSFFTQCVQKHLVGLLLPHKGASKSPSSSLVSKWFFFHSWWAWSSSNSWLWYWKKKWNRRFWTWDIKMCFNILRHTFPCNPHSYLFYP